MDDTGLCLDTNVLIAFLKGREPGATAVEKAVKTHNCTVAAICLEHGLPVLTANEKHFSRVPNLQVITPAALVQAD